MLAEKRTHKKESENKMRKATIIDGVKIHCSQCDSITTRSKWEQTSIFDRAGNEHNAILCPECCAIFDEDSEVDGE